MKFSIQLSAYYPDKSYGGDRLYADMLEQAVLADELGYDAVCITEHHLINILLMPTPLTFATKIAAQLGVPHLIIDGGEVHLPEFLANTPRRCYVCKRHVFGEISNRIKAQGVHDLAHGVDRLFLVKRQPGQLRTHRLCLGTRFL